MTPVLAADPGARRATIASHLAECGHIPRFVERVSTLRDALCALDRAIVITADPWPRALDYVASARAASVPTLVLWTNDPDENALTPGTSPQAVLAELARNVEREALESGAQGVLCWPASPLRLSAAVAAVAAGLRVIGIPELELGASPLPSPIESVTLSPRERVILSHVAAGTSNKRIARALGVSPETVKFHLRSVFRKLGVATRAEAVAEALRRGEIAL
jgi:DNA-binding CsgD family transcriptional regulator